MDPREEDRPSANPAERAWRSRLRSLASTHVGIVFTGTSELVDLSPGEMGKGVELGHCEVLFMSVATITLPGNPVAVTRIATRIESTHPARRLPARCGLALLVPSARGSSRKAAEAPPAARRGNRTVGVSYIAALPLRIFSHRARPAERREGFHYAPDEHRVLLPSTITVVTERDPRGVRPVAAVPAEGAPEGTRLSVSAGYQRHVLAALLLGLDDDAGEGEGAPGAYRAAEAATQAQWLGECRRRAQLLQQRFGADAAFDADTDALRVLEMLSLSFLLQQLCSRAAAPAVPDMFHSPLGVPFLVAMSINVCMHPKRYGLPEPSETDKYSCEELREALHTAWAPVMALRPDALAIDVSVNTGFKEAFASKLGGGAARRRAQRVMANLELLRRVGQRIVTEVATVRARPPRARAWWPNKGVPELCANPFARVEAAMMDPWGAQPAEAEAEVATTDRAEIHESLVRTLDSVELWLRTGRYADTQLTLPNDAEAQTQPQVMEVCVEAVELGSRAFAKWCADGPMSTLETLTFDTFLVTPLECAPCCGCGAPVHVLAAQLFNVAASACPKCHRRRCFMCSALVAKVASKSFEPCDVCASVDDGANAASAASAASVDAAIGTIADALVGAGGEGRAGAEQALHAAVFNFLETVQDDIDSDFTED